MEKSSRKQATIGIDLGGSNSMAIAFDSSFQVLEKNKISTQAELGYKSLLNRISNQITELSSKLNEKNYSLKGVGLAVPGIVMKDNMVSSAPNLSWNKVYPLNDLQFSKKNKIKLQLLNDVNAGLLGELANKKKIEGITLAYFCGTGIGGAVAIDGKILSGQNGGAGEVGHMIVKKNGKLCPCGRKGCLEAYIGKWALNKRIEKHLACGRKTLLSDLVDYDLKTKPVKSSSLKKAYFAADEFTLALMNWYYSKMLAVGISQSINLLNPSLLVLGGGMMESMGESLLPFIKNHLKEFCINELPEIQLSKLKDLAGPMGAASVVS